MKKRLAKLLATVPRITFVSGRANGKTNMTMEHIADHLLGGGVLVPPVAVGGVVYYPMVFDPEEGVENYVYEEKVHGVALLEDGTWLVRLFDGTWGPVGEDFFVTHEEAERRLADAK